MPQGSITDQDRDFVETWEHVSPQNWGIIRFDARGEERGEIVNAGAGPFRITTEERMITEDRIITDEDDPFKNGAFRPVTVPDSITIKTNPNALSEDEIREILSASDLAFAENLQLIDSVATYKRMLEVAEQMDDLTIKRYRMLEHRLDEVRGTQQITTKDEELKKFLTDDNEARRRATSSGMSANYR